VVKPTSSYTPLDRAAAAPGFTKPQVLEARSQEVVGASPGSSSSATAEVLEERALVGRARSGDTAAFRRLVERHQGRAYGVALRMLGSPADAEEAAQDAFVRAWRALPGFHGEARFSTWLHRIVVRCALDRSAILKARRSRETAIESEAAVDPSAALGRAEAASSAPELRRNLARMLDALSDVQRAAVVLYYYEDRSVDEVSRILGMPPGTVKTHLHRARALLRAAWMGEESRGTVR